MPSSRCAGIASRRRPSRTSCRLEFSEIEAAVLDYQNETLVAFVSAPSVGIEPVSVVAPAPAAWAAQVRESLARQLPAPSVPSRLFLVEKFVMKPVSGKIDRKRLPDLAHLLQGVSPVAEAIAGDAAPAAPNPPNTDADMTPECEEALDVCRAVFETPLGPDDGFAEAGAHSILIARLAQKLRAAGWTVPVRALLGDCNTARKIARRPRAAQAAAFGPRIQSPAGQPERDEAAARVLSVGTFTALQALFSALMYAPLLDRGRPGQRRR